MLAFIIARLHGADRFQVQTRTPLSRLPGFRVPPGTEKEKKVDVTIITPEQHRTLVTAKWSVRADREEQFVSDFRAYVALETSGQDFGFVLVTNEFDAARLLAACEKRRENAALFSAVVHVNPAGPRAVYERPRGAAVKLHEHIGRGRLISLEQWLTSLLAR